MPVQIGRNHAGSEAAQELARLAADGRRRKHAAVQHVIEAARTAGELSKSLSDIEVLDYVAEVVQGGDSRRQVA